MGNRAGKLGMQLETVQHETAAVDPQPESNCTRMATENAPHKPSRPLRVVIVEDEAFILLDLEDALSRAGHQIVATAVDADGAIAAVDQERPDVVLMDIRIIGPRDGVDAALEIRQRFDIPSIMISAFVDAAAHARLGPAQPHAILSKPIDFLGLQRALERL